MEKPQTTECSSELSDVETMSQESGKIEIFLESPLEDRKRKRHLLQEAVDKGAEQEVEQFLKMGSSARQLDMTQVRNLGMIRLLLRYGAPVPEIEADEEMNAMCLYYDGLNKAMNKQDSFGRGLLQRCCSDQRLHSLAMELIQCRRMSVDVTDNAGWTPLHEVVYLGNEELTKTLISICPKLVNALGHGNNTALHLAFKIHPELTTLLLEHGADETIRNSDGLKPHQIEKNQHHCVSMLDSAVKHGQLEVTSLLCASGHSSVQKTNDLVLSRILEKRCDEQSETDYDDTVTWHAIQSKHRFFVFESQVRELCPEFTKYSDPDSEVTTTSVRLKLQGRVARLDEAIEFLTLKSPSVMQKIQIVRVESSRQIKPNPPLFDPCTVVLPPKLCFKLLWKK